MLSYLITDPYFYNDFKTTLTNSIEKHTPDYICFRDKTSTKNAKLSIEIARFYKIPILINQHVELLNLGFDGIHLTSQQINLVDNYRECITFCSTHSFEEVKVAQNSDFITFSPIFNSKGRQGLGVDILDKVVEKTNSGVFGLGGVVSEKQINEISKTKAIGFGSIRYFLN